MDSFFNWLLSLLVSNNIKFEKEDHSVQLPHILIKFYCLRTPYVLETSDTFIVWQDQWHNDSEIIQSRIKVLIGLAYKIPARVCVVKNIDGLMARDFLDEHHLYHYSKSKIKLGLFLPESYQRLLPPNVSIADNLLGVMVFSGYRTFRNGDKSVEIIKFAFHKGILVVGGLSKLLSFYTVKYAPDHLMTYVEANTLGYKMIEKLGFKRVSETGPMYFELDENNKRILVKSPADIWTQGSLKYEK